MATKEMKIEVHRRDERGKAEIRRLRSEGFIPGIYYESEKLEAISFKVEQKLLRSALASDALVYHVTVGGTRKNVLIKEIQYHPVTDEILHVDFKGVHMDDKVDVQIPIHLLGKPAGVKDEGGQLHQTLMNVIISALTINIPTSFEIDVSEMHIGDAVHARDLELTEGVELVTAQDTLVVNVAHAKGVTEEEELVEEGEEFMFEDEEEDTTTEESSEE